MEPSEARRSEDEAGGRSPAGRAFFSERSEENVRPMMARTGDARRRPLAQPHAFPPAVARRVGRGIAGARRLTF